MPNTSSFTGPPPPLLYYVVEVNRATESTTTYWITAEQLARLKQCWSIWDDHGYSIFAKGPPLRLENEVTARHFSVRQIGRWQSATAYAVQLLMAAELRALRDAIKADLKLLRERVSHGIYSDAEIDDVMRDGRARQHALLE